MQTYVEEIRLITEAAVKREKLFFPSDPLPQTSGYQTRCLSKGDGGLEGWALRLQFRL